MNIGFDAKRAFHNATGLGHYSRTLITSLSKYYPQNQYYLFNPKHKSDFFQLNADNIKEVNPSGFLSAIFTSAWRSSWVKKDLKKNAIDIFHGLSHEIPLGIETAGIKSVVTIHDLIHERYPEQYKAIDRKIYTAKYINACRNSNRIIATSEQTRQDIISYYKVDGEKITVCYQSCKDIFWNKVTDDEKRTVAKRYNLPEQFFLYVGSVIERKNLLNICKAFFLLRNEMDIPLVVIGRGGTYKQQVKDYILQNGLEERIIFLSDKKEAQSSATFQDGEDFPAIYQQATAMIYPSFFEGFGIPVLEAMCSGLPVITSNTSCLPEVGGDAAIYVDPASVTEMAAAIKDLAGNNYLQEQMKTKGYLQAQKFSDKNCAQSVMNVYNSI